MKHAKWIFCERTVLVPTGEIGVAEGRFFYKSAGEKFSINDKGLIRLKKHKTIKRPYCSECEQYGDDEYDATPFCPYCGAKMDADKVGEPVTIFIKGRLPGLNDYIRADRADKHQGAKLKREVEDMIIWQLARMPKITEPARYHFTWYEPDERRDKDNVAFAKKFIFDALQKSGRLINDNNKYVVGFSDEFVYHVKEGVGVRIERAD